MIDTTQLRIEGDTELEKLVHRSRLIGSDPALVVHGGGNTSSKIVERDHLGRERLVLRVKGSGTDLKTIDAGGFPGVYLDEILPLRQRQAMTDEEMVGYLAHCMVDPAARRPSIETLLHGFLPARHVDHTHADAICALTNNPAGENMVRAALGEDVAFVPYIRPGFALSRQVGDLSHRRAVVLSHHGLVTWGETHEESLGATLELVARAKSFLARRTGPGPNHAVETLEGDRLEALLLQWRGRLSREQRRVLHIDRSQRDVADRRDVDSVASAGRATPDHVLRIGPWSAVVRAAGEVAHVVDAYESAYRAYFDRNQARLPRELGMLSPLPKVALVPGLGCVAAGLDARSARVNAEIAVRSHTVMAQARDAFGEVAWLNERDLFDIDYWPLELYKQAAAPPPPPLSGHIVVMAGVARDVARHTATYLAELGAHLILVDKDEGVLVETAKRLPSERVVTVHGDDAASAIRTATLTFGGLDAVVLAADALPIGPLVRQMRRAFDLQGIDGSLVRLIEGSPTVQDVAKAEDGGVRANGVRAYDVDVSLDQIAFAVRFLLLDEATAISGCVIPMHGSTIRV